ncbi:MAG TPA: DUF2950 domain-containing protein [Methylomirabilota bacterium]|jgi:hypothetical protein
MRVFRFAIVIVLACIAVAFAANGKYFESVDDAVKALIDAVRANDRKALAEILGEHGRALVFSGDEVADRNIRALFIAEYDKAHRLEGGGGKVVLYVGADDFPFPIPLIPDGPSWRWDAEAGREEILKRRIGRNELSAIQVCLAYVDAQREYYSESRSRDGVLEYAQRIRSNPGKHDGLYWPTKVGEPPSPLGLLVTRARGEGYARGAGSASGGTPYHGYYYRILLRQGASAADGAYDYVVGGHMIGGFGFLAYPAVYGSSGVMTFMVNHDGVVYQRDLGVATARAAAAIQSFDPDATWTRVDEATPAR